MADTQINRDDIEFRTEYDEAPDVSYLGEYTASPKGWYVDRAEQILYSPAGDPIFNIMDNEWVSPEPEEADFDDTEEGYDRYLEAVEERREEIEETRQTISQHQIGKFEISFNYQKELDDALGKSTDVKTIPKTKRKKLREFIKYAVQDYERAEGLNEGDWSMLHVWAEVVIDGNTFRSGGLSGVESDASGAYLKEIEGEEIAQLVEELGKYGVEVIDG